MIRFGFRVRASASAVPYFVSQIGLRTWGATVTHTSGFSVVAPYQREILFLRSMRHG